MNKYALIIIILLTTSSLYSQVTSSEKAFVQAAVKKYLKQNKIIGFCRQGIVFQVLTTQKGIIKKNAFGKYKGKYGQKIFSVVVKQNYCLTVNPNGTNTNIIFHGLIIAARTGAVLAHFEDINSYLIDSQLENESMAIEGVTESQIELAQKIKSFIENDEIRMFCQNVDCRYKNSAITPNPDFNGYIFDARLFRYKRYEDLFSEYLKKIESDIFNHAALKWFDREIISGKWCCSEECAKILNNKKLNNLGIPLHAPAVRIGEQIWQTTNLNVDTFQNGDSIPEVKSAEEWNRAAKNNQPAWCYYDNDPKNGRQYGKIYNWFAVIDARGLAPVGWHVPNLQEIEQLVNYLGGEESAGGKMKSKSGWSSTGFESNGTNESNFSAIPGGDLHCNGELNFSGIKYSSSWWTSTSFDVEQVNTFWLGTGGEGWMGDSIGLNQSHKKLEGLYVRCIKD